MNAHRTRELSCRLAIDGKPIRSGKSFRIAADPWVELTSANGDPMQVQTADVPVELPIAFPPASVTALELRV
ncbi:MAG: hypothetical protein K0Q72_4441 [Armatimonadetes bacterium]|nr:hypothetical protein [Armatimonadota bacterium]